MDATELFNERIKDYAHIKEFQGGRILPGGLGSSGAVGILQDGHLIKFNDRHDVREDMYYAQGALTNEVKALDVLEELGFPAPRRITGPLLIPHGPSWALYVMTRLPGKSALWHRLFEGEPDQEEKRQRFAFKAGELLAQFHEAVMPRKHEFAISYMRRYDYSFVEHVHSLGADVNDGLSVFSDYLGDHAIDGVVHGDFHSANIMADDDGNITGLIDFQHTAPSANIYVDLCNVPLDVLQSVIDGYEQGSWKPFDDFLLESTRIALVARQINLWAEKGYSTDRMVKNLYDLMRPFRARTGFTPPDL